MKYVKGAPTEPKISAHSARQVFRAWFAGEFINLITGIIEHYEATSK
jgi:hypothetical protein